LKAVKMILSALAILCYILILAVFFIAAPMAAGYRPVVVLSGSMEPAFKPGSVIYYKPASFESIQKNDVISYSKRDDAKTLVTHRVVEVDKENREFKTKGDANTGPDPRPVAYADVKGKAMDYHLPYAGYYIQYARNYFAVGGVFLILLLKLILDRIPSKGNQPKQEAGMKGPAEM